MTASFQTRNTVAGTMARLAKTTTFESLDMAVVEYTKLLTLSCLGSMIRGSDLTATKVVKDYIRRQGAIHSATVAGEDFRTSSELAALANATFAHATEYEDDSFPEGVSTYTLVPPLLALAEERHLSGKSLIAAIVAGHEIQSRLGLACLHALDRGYQLLPLLGTLATAAGAALMMNLTERQVAMAVCISTSQAAGIRIQNQYMTHFLESGTAARAGLFSAYLAEGGFDAADYVFEGLNGSELGFLEMLSGPRSPDPNAIFQSWGSPYRILDVSMKLYPVCGLLQPVVQGVMTLRKQGSFVAADIAQVEVVGNGSLAEVCDIPNPSTDAAATMSLHHVVASAFIDPEVTINSLRRERVADPHVSELRRRVQLRIDEGAARGFLTSPIEVRLKLKSGELSTVKVSTIHGLPPQYLTREEILTKFQRTTEAMISTERMNEIVACVDRLDEMDDLDEVTRLLCHESISNGPRDRAKVSRG